jgi:hypothetical protein
MASTKIPIHCRTQHTNVTLTPWVSLSGCNQILGVMKIQQDINTYHCEWAYVPSDCWTGWNVHGRCHTHTAFHPCVYEDDVSAWMCRGLHKYSVDTDEKKQKETQQLFNTNINPDKILKKAFDNSHFWMWHPQKTILLADLHITLLDRYYEITVSLNIHAMKQKGHKSQHNRICRATTYRPCLLAKGKATIRTESSNHGTLWQHHYFFFHGATAPSGPGLPHYQGFMITLNYTHHTW